MPLPLISHPPSLAGLQSPSRATSWAPELGRLLRHRFLLKFCGISAFAWVFFLAYFYLLRHPVQAPLVMPLLALDHWIAFEPSAFWAYVSLWVYVGIPAGMMPSLRHLVLYGLWIGGLCLTGLAIFYLYPTAVPLRALPPELAGHPGFALLQGVDAAGNAFPSLHVATAAFSAIWIDRLLRLLGAPWMLRGFNLLWLLLIIWSTVAIRQHVVLDVIAGLLLAALFAWPSLRWFLRRPHDLLQGAR